MSIALKDFQYLAELIYTNAAIVVKDKHLPLLERKMSRFVEEQKLNNVAELVAMLKSQKNKALEHKLIDAVTVNETFFFRDPLLFDDLRKHIFPEFIKMRATTKTLNIWCAACSSGQEPYTIAMVLANHFPELKKWKIRIIASDISEPVLETARNGIYTELEIARGLPNPMRDRFFNKKGTVWQINEDIRNIIEFRKVNLIQPLIGFPKLDIIFVRNVLIYFDTEVKQAIVLKLTKLLQPDGALLLGAGETMFSINENYELRDKQNSSIYQLKQKKC